MEVSITFNINLFQPYLDNVEEDVY